MKLTRSKERVLKALDDLEPSEFRRFKWLLGEPGHVEGVQPLAKCALQDTADQVDVVDLIFNNYPGTKVQLVVILLEKVNRRDLKWKFENTPTAQKMRDLEAAFEKLKVSRGPPVSPGTPTRRELLEHASPLSLDPNTAEERLILSENNMKVTFTEQYQPYADHPERFTRYPQVLSRESVSDGYFEVEGSGESVYIAVSYKDIDRAGGSSGFGSNDQSWRLACYGPDDDDDDDDDELYVFSHNSIHTYLSVPVSPTGRNRWGVYVDHRRGILRFYHVKHNGITMTLLHTVRTTFTRPLYAGIRVYKATAKVCEIW